MRRDKPGRVPFAGLMGLDGRIGCRWIPQSGGRPGAPNEHFQNAFLLAGIFTIQSLDFRPLL